MQTMIHEELAAWMRSAFEAAFAGTGADGSEVTVTPTTNIEFGDFQCNAAMALAKALKRKPREVAQAALDKAAPHEGVARTDLAGPGFINIHLSNGWIMRRLEAMAADPRLGVPERGQGRTVVMDYSSPNVAKPMHIGHLRSMNIGSAVDRMYRYLGYRVIADNHIGDWGTQFGILIVGYRNFLDPEALALDPVAELERIYVKCYERAKDDPAWMDQCRSELVKLQAGDPENRALWQKFVDLSLADFDRIYRRMGVRFDLTRGESFYNDRLPGVVELLEKKGLATPSEGATIIDLESEGLQVCIVRKKDGAFNYTTTDLATVAGRVEEFNPDTIIYFTDERQQLHFRQIFAVCRKLGVTTKLQHVWFGLMRLPEGVFSTRQGNVIKLEKLLDEAEARALAVVKASSPEMDEVRQRDVARAVGLGAVKYADLSSNPQTLVTFTWEKAMALDGDSGPYLQYTHARISSVADKHAERFPGLDPDRAPLQVTEPAERTLALELLRFPDTLVRAAENYRPSVLTEYLNDLAQAYNGFYQNVPFLKAPEGIRESRVRLCKTVARVLRQGLDLLGIEAPDRI